MEKDLPKIFKNDVKKTNSNNRNVYYSLNDKEALNRNKDIDNIDNLNKVEEKLKKIFKSSKYVFNIGVIIKTDKKDYDTKIAGKIKNSIITVDNEIIPIIEINDIIVKDRT